MIVQDLLDLLNHLAPDATIVIDGADYGGYDVIDCDAAGLIVDDEGRNSLRGIDTTKYKLKERIKQYTCYTKIVPRMEVD